ncbi:hypothetical protein D8674_008610 [Pyrus ussuriensis x Pyrus communis]|uniref:Retrotransposon gag domain-containing protein n=1 Tax=Pyrus ussuriensis x Pyrus communis TaxID=2448454 RepID=A0A5N5HXX9_9ROSA|nr:hypothetical protein D8674_008610 [Pyrus ussuriensis x Pyrus communis]
MRTRRSKSIDLDSYDPEVERTFRKLRGTIKQKRASVSLPPSSPPHLKDANKHLMEFHVVCSGMRPANVDEEQVKLRAFPFTLEAKAKEWLYNLPPGSMNTWNQVKQAFLEQYFPATKAASIRKDICAIRQQHGEPFGDYYERFTHLVASCPNHQISEHLLIQYFYEGLCGTDRVMLDAASGGAFMDKTPTNAKALLKNIAGNTRQFGGRDELPLKKVNEVSANSSIELQLANLTNLVQQVMVAPKQVCSVCSMMGHATDMCPSLMDQGGLEQANALGGFQGQQRQKYDPYSNNYNAGWRDHPHLKWNNQDNGQQSVPNNYNRPPGFFQARPQAPFQPQQQQAPSKSLEDLIASLANSTQSHQQKTDKAIENLERQMSHHTSPFFIFSAQKHSLPSPTSIPTLNTSFYIIHNPQNSPKPLVPQQLEEKRLKSSYNSRLSWGIRNICLFEVEEEAKARFEEEVPTMAADNRTIKELSASGLANAAPLCIQYPNAAPEKTDEFELKSSLLHHIPKFHGLSMEDPNKHLKEFEVVCSSMTPVNVDGSILKMKAFPFSLMDKAKDWLYDLAPRTVTSWESMKRAFLEKFFPTSRIILLRKRISGIQQDEGESFPTYYERFKSLVASCPQHQMKEELLLQYFYEGLLPMERQMLDASAGGALVDKTPTAAKMLIANRALNAQQYEGVGQRTMPRQHQVNEVSAITELKNQMANLTTLLSQVVEGPKVKTVASCGVCSMQGHPTDTCPQLIENGGWETLNAVRYGNQYQSRGDPFSNTYNPGWRDHPNFKWRDPQQSQQQSGFRQQPPGFYQKPLAPLMRTLYAHKLTLFLSFVVSM